MRLIVTTIVLVCSIHTICFGMVKVLSDSTNVEQLVSVSVDNFHGSLNAAHEKQVVSESFSAFLMELYKTLYESDETASKEKLSLAIAFYQERLETLEIKDLLEVYIYLDRQKNSDRSSDELFIGNAELGIFYQSLKEIFSQNTDGGINIFSPRSSVKCGPLASRGRVSPGRPRKAPPKSRSRLVSPRGCRALYDLNGDTKTKPVRKPLKNSDAERTQLPGSSLKKRPTHSVGSLGRSSGDLPTIMNRRRANSSKNIVDLVRRRQGSRSSAAESNRPKTQSGSALGSPEFRRKKSTTMGGGAPIVKRITSIQNGKGFGKGGQRHKSNTMIARNKSRPQSMFKRSPSMSDRVQIAVLNSDVQELKSLVDGLVESKEIDTLLVAGERLLLWAIEKDSIMLTLLLLKAGANSDLQGKKGMTPLMVAIEMAKEAFCTIFLEKSKNVSLADSAGRTALHYAAKKGNRQMVDQLIKKNEMLLDVQDKNGHTALMTAIVFDNLEVLLILLRNGADVYILKDIYDNTVLHHLAASKECPTQVVCSALPSIAEESLNSRNKEGFTPLMSAVLKKNDVITDWLLNKGAQFDVVDERGDSLLHICAREGFVESSILRLPTSINDANKDGFTPLMLATVHDHREFCEKLLGLDAQLDCTNNVGDTVLHLAAQYGNMYLCQRYLERFTKVAHDPQDELYDGTNARNVRGYTPLMCAVEEGHDHIALHLLNNGADVQCLGLDGESAYSIALHKGLALSFNLSKKGCTYCKEMHGVIPEHFICDVQQGNRDNVLAYLKQEMPADTKDTQGVTVLETAAKAGHLSVVKLLVESGASRVAQALQFARENNRAQVIAYLEQQTLY